MEGGRKPTSFWAYIFLDKFFRVDQAFNKRNGRVIVYQDVVPTSIFRSKHSDLPMVLGVGVSHLKKSQTIFFGQKVKITPGPYSDFF